MKIMYFCRPFRKDGMVCKCAAGFFEKGRHSSAVEHVICNLGVGGPNPSAGSG